jgi:hypothetical protein
MSAEERQAAHLIEPGDFVRRSGELGWLLVEEVRVGVANPNEVQLVAGGRTFITEPLTPWPHRQGDGA